MKGLLGQKMAANNEFEQFLEKFPPSVQKNLETIPHSGGMLTGEHCRAVMENLNISAEELMLRLLPLARLYSRTPISDFRVGAVVKAQVSQNLGDDALFLGGNIEFPGRSLTHTVHAEQAAVANAWLQGAGKVETISASAPPCGYCRQFLCELEDGANLTVVLQKPDSTDRMKFGLSDLLPHAFGPRELGSHAGLMASVDPPIKLRLQRPSDDPIVQTALAAAGKAYAPYSHNLAGCTIQTGDGRTFSGRYAENAAFNPSLSPLHTAIIRMNMDNLEQDNTITRTVLVEKPTSVSQRTICDLLLESVSPEVELEYLKAVGSTI